ncbi:glycosyltransferase family 2 protein [Neobacillus sp. LXY-4]|uniref:glycosyltransferase family 2 protein n=1 Tax=Neobacillus sp. LXY-4 TaxID=3379826 RepID=UPI003EE16B51
MPTVISVIIPVYNVEKYLSICLKSVLEQTMGDFEVLLINDGSTDNSANICEHYAQIDKRVKVFHTSNSGPGKARNKGLKEASGKYIMFIDSDDYVDQNTFKIALNIMEKNNVDLVIYSFYKIKLNEIEKRELSECYFKDPFSKARFLEKIWLDEEMLASTWNKIYKLDVIKKNSISFNEDFFMAEDYLFNIQYIDTIEKGISINSPLYHYIKHENSVTTRVLYNKYYIALTVYKESLKLLNKYNIKEEKYLNKIHSEYLTGLLRAMYETTRHGYNENLIEKLKEIKKCMNGKETRELLSNSLDLSMYNRFVAFCLKNKQSILYYIAFKIRNTAKGF